MFCGVLSLVSGVQVGILNEKTNNLGFQPGPTQTGLYSHRGRPET